MPLSPVFRNLFKAAIPRKGHGCSLGTPSRHTRESIRTIPDHSQVVRDRLRRYAELRLNGGLVAHDVAAAIQLNNSRADYALTQILVGRANEHTSHAFVSRSLESGGSQGIIGLVMNHWPDHDAHCLESLF